MNDSSKIACSTSGDALLLTPGPLTTSLSVKQAMLHDYGSRDGDFIALNKRILERLVDIANATASHVAVPLQGSGTFAVEAMIGNFIPTDGKALLLINGAYGQRIAKICDYYHRDYCIIETPEDTPVDLAALSAALADDKTISHVVVVHCETTSGILNPIAEVAAIVAAAGRALLIDAMSAFGALPLDAQAVPFDAVVASSNKCLEGAPGVGFCIARQTALQASAGNSPSLVLDLYDQWQAMQANQQWRFTPPTHVLLALDQALQEYDAEGGLSGRGKRYADNCQRLVSGMRKMGFQTLLPDELQAPIIITFLMPRNDNFDFAAFYDGLKDQGYVIYPGKLTVADSFRMGCIGQLHLADIDGALQAVANTLHALGVERINYAS